MLPSSEALSQLVGSLYDAASDPTLWQQFLQQLSEKTGAGSAALVMYDAAHQSYALSSHWRFDPEAVNLYGEYYGSLDVWAQRALSKRASLVCSSESLSPSSELIRTEIYHDFLTRFGIEHGLFALFENTGSRLVSCSLFRDSSRGPFQATQLEMLRFLAPHVQRAVKLHVRFSELRGQSVALEAALDSVPTGVIFLGPNGKVVFMNRSASDLISENDGLWLDASAALRAERQAESELLARTIQQAARNSKGPPTGGTIVVSRRTRPPLQVLISPISQMTASTFCLAQPINAALFVVDPSRRQRPAVDLLRALFGLTPAECRVALLLGDGHAPKEIANLVGVTDNTVRSQIKSIFSKTGVRRQSELIRLLLTNPGAAIRQQSARGV